MTTMIPIAALSPLQRRRKRAEHRRCLTASRPGHDLHTADHALFFAQHVFRALPVTTGVTGHLGRFFLGCRLYRLHRRRGGITGNRRHSGRRAALRQPHCCRLAQHHPPMRLWRRPCRHAPGRNATQHEQRRPQDGHRQDIRACAPHGSRHPSSRCPAGSKGSSPTPGP